MPQELLNDLILIKFGNDTRTLELGGDTVQRPVSPPEIIPQPPRSRPTPRKTKIGIISP